MCIVIIKFVKFQFTSYCSYDHDDPRDTLEYNKKIAELEKKAENLEKTEARKDSSEFAKEVDRKVEVFENKFAILDKVIEEKDSVTNALETGGGGQELL